MSSFWENPEFKSGEFVEWEDGVVVVGTVTALDVHTFPESERGPARTVPKVILRNDSGHDQEITCGSADLKKKIVQAAPNVGDRVRIECIGSNKIALGIQRFFKVDVKRPDAPAAPAANAIPDEPPF